MEEAKEPASSSMTGGAAPTGASSWPLQVLTAGGCTYHQHGEQGNPLAASCAGHLLLPLGLQDTLHSTRAPARPGRCPALTLRPAAATVSHRGIRGLPESQADFKLRPRPLGLTPSVSLPGSQPFQGGRTRVHGGPGMGDRNKNIHPLNP